jgi:hypothetical protein
MTRDIMSRLAAHQASPDCHSIFTTRMALRVPFEFHVLTSSLTALGMVVSVAGTPRQARSDGSR